MSSGGKEFAVNTPGGQVRLADLPLEVLDGLETETGRRWTELLMSPAATAKSALAVYAAACRENGSEPEKLTPRRLIAEDQSVFEMVDEDMPTVFEDGLPKAGDEAPTSGSSGAPSDGAGPRK